MLSGETDEEEACVEIYLLDELRTEFGLRPWAGVGDRLRVLEQRYAPELEVLDFEEWRARNGV